jgi:excisionase family DNA binding protein
MNESDELLSLLREQNELLREKGRAEWEATHTAAVRRQQEKERQEAQRHLEERQGKKPGRHPKAQKPSQASEPIELPTGVMDIKQAARYLQISVRQVHNYLEKGELNASKFGRSLRFTQKALDDFIERHPR